MVVMIVCPVKTTVNINNQIQNKLVKMSFGKNTSASEVNKDIEAQKKFGFRIISVLFVTCIALLGILHHRYCKNLKELLGKFNELGQKELKSILKAYHYDDRNSLVTGVLKNKNIEKVKTENIKNLISDVAKKKKIKSKAEENFGDKVTRFFDNF